MPLPETELNQSAPIRLLVATGNAHKTAEIHSLLGFRCSVVDLSAFTAVPAVVEDAPDFRGNAAKKARTIADWLLHQPGVTLPDFVLADDSGLEVDALHGAPGVHSARFAALDTGAPGNSPDGANNAKLLRLLAGVPAARRTARFRCVLALTVSKPGSDASVEFFEGTCEGRLLEQPRGAQGFGYDPLFVPDGASLTFSELGGDVKNQISHRARALRLLSEHLVSVARPRIAS